MLTALFIFPPYCGLFEVGSSDKFGARRVMYLTFWVMLIAWAF